MLDFSGVFDFSERIEKLGDFTSKRMVVGPVAALAVNVQCFTKRLLEGVTDLAGSTRWKCRNDLPVGVVLSVHPCRSTH